MLRVVAALPMSEFLPDRESLLLLLRIIGAIAAVAASLHAILYKRDVRATIGWVGFIWIAPLAGPLLYLLFGVNRIRRRAGALRGPAEKRRRFARVKSGEACPVELPELARLGDRICNTSLVPGNRIDPLPEGEPAFDAMLGAIASSRHSISISTYIFELDTMGRRFIDALVEAAGRGIAIRVLIDAVGSRPPGRALLKELASAGVVAARFLAPRNPASLISVNLRNHRKILIVDGRIGFTGGMNISDDYAMLPTARRLIRDVHFRIEGPVVPDLQSSFAGDWLFTTGEQLEGELWFPGTLARSGDAVARVVADGPDESFELNRWLILGALATARHSVRVASPYFLPDSSLITALGVAALRGVDVRIAIPERLDHQFVKWASNAQLWQVLERGCRVWFTPPPFDHSKLLTVDGVWTLFGSTNWDARSLRLNFELNVEAHDRNLAGMIESMIEQRISSGREITLAEMDARGFAVRLRDGLARLLTPYL